MVWTTILDVNNFVYKENKLFNDGRWSEAGKDAKRVAVRACEINRHAVNAGASIYRLASAQIGQRSSAEPRQCRRICTALPRIVEQCSEKVDAFVGRLSERVQGRRPDTKMAVITLLERQIGIRIQRGEVSRRDVEIIGVAGADAEQLIFATRARQAHNMTGKACIAKVAAQVH